ncbi:MAG: adenine deaminase, partial [Spirochaetes bacterium]
ALHYNLKNIGALKPRYWADFVFLSDLENVTIEAVYKKGQPVFRNGGESWSFSGTLPSVRSTMNPGEIKEEDIAVRAEGKKIRVIDIVPGQIVTGELIKNARIVKGSVEPDIENDILKVVVIERHSASGNIGKAFVHGLGLKNGAIASTVAHDSHNIVIVGTNDRDIYTAFKHISKIQGGLAAVKNGKVIGDLPLPVAGLLSELRYEKVVDELISLRKKVRELGCTHKRPFMILSFLCLSAIPKLKVTDLGLINVSQFKVVPVFAD